MTLDQAHQINKTHAAVAVAIWREWRGFIFTAVELARFVQAEIEFSRTHVLGNLNRSIDHLIGDSPSF